MGVSCFEEYLVSLVLAKAGKQVEDLIDLMILSYCFLAHSGHLNSYDLHSNLIRCHLY